MASDVSSSPSAAVVTATTNNNVSATSSSSSPSSGPQISILIENPKKSTNWGPLLRCCAAFGIPQIFVVGYDQCSVQGSHGANKHVELVAFHNHQTAVQTLKGEWNFQLVGFLQGAPDAYDDNDDNDDDGYHVTKKTNPEFNETSVHVASTAKQHDNDNDNFNVDETKGNHLLPKSFPVHKRLFGQKTCLVVGGKKGRGLPLSLAEHCDSFVHIPHCDLGNDNTSAWLTLEAGVSIVLYEFAAWAGYDNRASAANNTTTTAYQGQKYHVERKRKGSKPDSNDKHLARKQKQEELAQETDEVAGSLFLMPGDEQQGGDY